MLYYDIVDRFTALSDPNRRKIIELLARRGPLSASEISEQFSVSPPAISQHLKVLRETRLVRVEKRAQQRIYSIDPEAIREVGGWAEQVTQLWNQRFDALARFLEIEKKKARSGEKQEENQDAKPNDQ
jgi:DNA-binding transcriptional ArsR family regulator